MQELKALFAQLRLDVAAAPTPQHAQMAIDRAEINAQSLLLQESARVREQAYNDGRGLAKLSGGMVPIRRDGGKGGSGAGGAGTVN